MKLSRRFSDALVFANVLHGEQVRKVSGTPYVAHLLRVAGIVLEHGANEDEAIAALLHDAVEDQGGADARRQIRDRYGDTVALIVDGLSDTDQMPKPPWRGAERGLHREPSNGFQVGSPGIGGRQAGQCPIASGELSRAWRFALGQLQGRPRRHALVSSQRGGGSEELRRHATGRGTRLHGFSPGRAGAKIAPLGRGWPRTVLENGLQISYAGCCLMGISRAFY